MPFRALKRVARKLFGGSKPRQLSKVQAELGKDFDPSKIIGGRSKIFKAPKSLAKLKGLTPKDIDSRQMDKKTGAIRLGAGGIKLTPEAIARLKKQEEEEEGKKKSPTPAGFKKGGMVKKTASKGRGMGAATRGGGACAPRKMMGGGMAKAYKKGGSACK